MGADFLHNSGSGEMPSQPTRDQYQQLLAILRPHAAKEIKDAREGSALFAYYTTGDVACSILRSRRIWLRNAMTMNDFTEVSYGLHCLEGIQKTRAWGKFLRLSDEIQDGAGIAVNDRFNSWREGMLRGTHLVCFSKYDEAKEGSLGRLSMWRAYGERSGVAMIFDAKKILEQVKPIPGLHASPVSYGTPAECCAQFDAVADLIERHAEIVSEIDRKTWIDETFHMLRMLVLCTKHPGFAEEREWRIMASPEMYPGSSLFDVESEVVRGTLQLVVKVKLEPEDKIGLGGFSLPEILHRVIVGPCDYPIVVADAMNQELYKAGLAADRDLVWISAIPLRHTS